MSKEPKGAVMVGVVVAFTLLSSACGEDETGLCSRYCDKVLECIGSSSKDACMTDCKMSDPSEECMEKFIDADCDGPLCT